MRQVASQGAITTRLVAFVIVSFFVVGATFAHAQNLRFEIPYEFSVGSKMLSAGTYTFSVKDSWLVVQSGTSGQSRVMIVTRLSEPAEFLRDGSLVFDHADGHRILSEVWLPGMDGLLIHRTPESHSRDVLSTSDLSQSRVVSGKTAYKLTCGGCHGQDGKGDERADKFFNTKIPRLSSAEVQGKLDAELKEIINQGTSTMPPVEVEESGFRHRLPPQDVDGVIAYVRTLKQ
jgi:mono/diheme cytochrome c family protein